MDFTFFPCNGTESSEPATVYLLQIIGAHKVTKLHIDNSHFLSAFQAQVALFQTIYVDNPYQSTIGKMLTMAQLCPSI